MHRYFSGKARPLPPRFLAILALWLALILAGIILYRVFTKPIEVKDFASCVKAGNPVLESYPEQCVHKGQSYINPNQNIPSPF